MCCLFVTSITSCASTIKNQKTESYHVSGNCGMCENTIETAVNVKGTSAVDWNRDTKLARISFDAKKTNSQEVLKKIALAGYDNDAFIAPDQTYSKLPGCCQYIRKVNNNKPPALDKKETVEQKVEPIDIKDQGNVTSESQFKNLFDNYISLKDALVNSEGGKASQASKALLVSINSIKMNVLSETEHLVWMKITSDFKKDADFISKTTNIERQRDHFGPLSDNMFELMKVAKLDYTIYYQHCPMANGGEGANWLSKESTIKNPFYGTKMLSCGTTVEVIKR